MSHEVNDLLQRTADQPTRPLNTTEVVTLAQRQTRFARAASGLGAAAVLTLVSVVAWPMISGDDQGVEIADGPGQTDDAGVLTERAPVAGSDASHWPVELVYREGTEAGSSDHGASTRFRGTSWAAWTAQGNVTADGVLPEGEWREPDGPGFDDSDTWVEDSSQWRGLSLVLQPDWRPAIGLDERVVVDLEQIPGAPDLIASLGLTPEEVEAYASPNVAGCEDVLERCALDDPNAARGIAHLETGFPLFVEEQRDGQDAYVWLEAVSFAYGDATGIGSTAE